MLLLSTGERLTAEEIDSLNSATDSEIEELFLSLPIQDREAILEALIALNSPPEPTTEQTLSLYEFGKLAWAILRPGEVFIDGEHIRVLCAHLEYATDTPNYKLAVMLPPNCGKSIWSTVIWPAWVWGPRGWAAARFLFTTYSQDRSRDDSGKFERLVRSEWYQSQWGPPDDPKSDYDARRIVALTSDALSYFENTAGGQRKAAGVGGLGTGEHPHFVVVDDANKAEDPPIAFRSAIAWWKGQMSSRGIVASIGSRRIALGQRLQMDDVPGACIALGYDTVCLPMWAWSLPTKEDIERKTWFPQPTAIGWVDWRKPGELLWPEGIIEAAARELETTLGPIKAAAQLHQRPIRALLNGMFPRSNIADKMIDWENVPWGEIDRIIRYWDKAGGESVQADYTAGVCIARWLKKSPVVGVKPEVRLIVLNVVRGRWNAFERNKVIRQTTESDIKTFGGKFELWIEAESMSGAGVESRQLSQRELTDLGVRFDKPDKAKIIRARGFSSAWYGGLVYIVTGSWNSYYLDELEVFDGEESTDDKKDDCVDGSSGAANKLLMVSTTRAAPPTGGRSKV
jgi:predicted phage terminase large subunit-like protein